MYIRNVVVELEARLANPSYRLMQLLTRWRSLPDEAVPQAKPSIRRRPQRAEERLGPDGVAQLVADYEAGQPSTALMRTYGLSKGAVLRLLEVNGVPRRRRGLTSDQERQAIELYQRGWSLTRVGNHFGKDHSVVLHLLERSGVPRRHSR